VNRLAVRLDLPLFWVADANHNKTIDAEEVKTLLFYDSAPVWSKDGRFTPEFELAYSSLLAAAHPSEPAESPEEAARRALVLDDLDQGKPMLVYSDLRSFSATDRAAIAHLIKAAYVIDRLFAIQTGMEKVRSRVPKDDAASRSLFRRNWGAKCKGPRTEKNPACSAIPGAPKPIVDLYPDDLQDDPKFCEKLESGKNGKKLMAPYFAVRERPDGSALDPVKYSEIWPGPMGEVAAELEAAANALGPDEKAFAEYLRADAQSFRDNDWDRADDAWSRMNGDNSKFYLRVAPDEVYWDPCMQKAGFHESFALINRASKGWEQKLSPHQQEMEAAAAKLIGPPYRERKVSFHLPQFIDVVLNAGDDRDAFGATVGQSLPNWGKIADQSRGRTVAMSNLYTDADSLAMRRAEAATLVEKDSLAVLKDDPTAGLLETILHEATHNLGPSQEYKFAGKTDSQAFGGGIASMLEELKAQTGALYYLDFLAKKGVITPDLQKQSYIDSVVWAFGHIAQGMYEADGQRKPYSQLAAIQVGFLMDEGALEWVDAPAANGTDKGAFRFHFEKFPAACEHMMAKVAHIKAINDKAGALALTKRYVDSSVVPQTAIGERVLRFPKNSFVYAIDL
jgi:hypothetical protein